MTVLVTGATGNIGRKVVDHLVAAGVPEIRALTTDPAKANLPAGVEVVTGFLGKPETLSVALADVDRVYLAPYPPTLGITLEMMAAARVSYCGGALRRCPLAQHADAIAAAPVPAVQLGPGEFCENFAMLGPADRGHRHHPGAVPGCGGGHPSRWTTSPASRPALLAAPADAHLAGCTRSPDRRR
jgi:hypothetical protein